MTTGAQLKARALGALLALALVAVGAWAAWSYWGGRSLGGQIRRGLDLLARADTPGRVRDALDRWEDETRPMWDARRDDLITRLCSDYKLEDPRVRLLLTRVAGVDYGDRREDWQRWTTNRKRLRAGQPPQVPKGEGVRLEQRWSSPIGLTAWFSTIIALDGQIYISSLGANFDNLQDDADGVVRVDGVSGVPDLLFTPPDPPSRGPRDVIGIAAGDDCLFAGCLNGSVYSIEKEGKLRWQTHVGSSVVSPPLSCDLNGDGVCDVVVVTRDGKVYALSGKKGTTMWVTTVGRPPAAASMLGATLALGDLLPGQGPEILVTTPLGEMEALVGSNGRSRWKHTLAAGTVAGAICRGAGAAAGPVAYTADRDARIWSIVTAGQSLEATQWAALALRREETLIASLRTLRKDGDGPPLLLACPTGETGEGRGGVCALGPAGVQWRLPVGGAVWGTPAVADLNGDRETEILVVSTEGDGQGGLHGVLTVVSPAGHCVHRLIFQAPLEASPVVADVDGDNRLEVLVADQAGYLHCFGTGAQRAGPVLWGTYGGDSHNTRNATNAFSFGQLPFRYQWRWELD